MEGLGTKQTAEKALNNIASSLFYEIFYEINTRETCSQIVSFISLSPEDFFLPPTLRSALKTNALIIFIILVFIALIWHLTFCLAEASAIFMYSFIFVEKIFLFMW